MGNVKFGVRFKSRPLKSAGGRRRRIRVHQRRLLAAGWKDDVVLKMDAKSLREAIKTI